MKSKEKTPRRIKRKRLEIAILNKAIKRLLFLAVGIIMLLPAIDPTFSLKNLNFWTTKAGDDDPQTTSVIGDGIWHSSGPSNDISLDIADLYSGNGPVDFTFSEDTTDNSITLEKQTIYPLADNGETGEINDNEDNKDIEINFEWKFEKKTILDSNWQGQQKDVATLIITYKNATDNLGLLSTPLFDFTDKTENSNFSTNHYPFSKSIVYSVSFTAIAQLFDTGNQNGNALFFQLGNGEFDSSRSAVPGSQMSNFFAIHYPHSFSWDDQVAKWLQLIPTGEGTAQYQMSFEFNDIAPAFKMPITFQMVQLTTNEGDNYKFGTDYSLDVQNLYQHFKTQSKSFPTDKSYEIFAIRDGASYDTVNTYLNSTLNWGEGLPVLHKGSMFDTEDDSDPTSIEITPFANLSIGSSVEASATILPESASDLPIVWSAWRIVNNVYIRADDANDPDNQYVTIDNAHITALKAGDIVIRARVTFGEQSLETEEPLKIIDPDLPVNISVGNFPDLEIGSSYTATRTLLPATAKGVTTWSSNNSEIASINATTGVITGLAEGEAEITATHTYMQTGFSDIVIFDTKTINVIKPIVKVESVAITPNENFELYLANDANANANNTWRDLQATVTPSNAENKKIIWSTNDAQIAQVTQDGRVTSVAPGTTTITATAEDTSQGVKSASVEVLVRELSNIPPTQIVVKGNETNDNEEPAFKQTIPKRQTHKVEYQIYPENATQTDVTFSIAEQSAANVIEINDEGVITAKNVGTAIIQVTSVADPNVHGRLFIVVEENENIQEIEGTYLTNPANVVSRSSLSARLIANVGGSDYFPIVDSQKYERVQATAINFDPSINKNIRVTTGSKIDAATKRNNGNWDQYVGINERFQGDYEIWYSDALQAERASGIYAETLSYGNEKKIIDIQGTALSDVTVDKSTWGSTANHNRSMYSGSSVSDISAGIYSYGNTTLAQTGPVIYYTQNFAPNGHLGDVGRYSSLERGENPNGNAPASDTGGLKNGQGMYAVNFRQAVYMKYGDYANNRYSSSASVVFPPLTEAQLQASDSNPKTLKFGSDKQTEYIRVEYEEVGSFEDANGKRRPMSCIMTISNIVYGTGGGTQQWVGANGEYRPSISFSNNLYSGFFYQNIKAFTVDFKFYAADEENDPTYKDYGKELNFAKTLTASDFDSEHHLINQNVSEDVVNGSIITFRSLNRSDTDGGNKQTEFAGAIATNEDLTDSLNLVYGGYIENNTALGSSLQLLKIGLMAKQTSIGLNGNAPNHNPDLNDDTVFKSLSKGTYYAGGYTDGTDYTSEYYFYDILGQSTYLRGGVSFPIWGVEHQFLIGGSKGHTYNSISSRSLRVAEQDAPNKTVTTTLNDKLQNAPENFYSGDDSFSMRYDNDLDRLWELEKAFSSPSQFLNKYINGTDPLNHDYYSYYEELPTIEKILGLSNPNFIGAVVPLGLDSNLGIDKYLRKNRVLDNQVPILKYWLEHGKTGNAILAADGTKFLPVKNMRFVGKSGVVDTNYNSNPEHTGNEFTYYINQPMIDLLKTEITPTTIEMYDHLPEGIEVNGDIKVYDNLGKLITTFSKSSVVTISGNGTENIHVTLQDDADNTTYSEETDHLSYLVKNFLAQNREYGDILKVGISNEFTYEIPVRVKQNYRGLYKEYNNAAMVTFTYGDVGETPRSLVTNAVQVATRAGNAAFAFNKQVLTDEKTGAGNTISEGVTFKLYDQGVSSNFPASANLTNEYITDNNQHPIYGANGYFEIVLIDSDLIQDGAVNLSNVQWLVLNEETTNIAYNNETLKKFEFGVYVDQTTHEFVFIRKNKTEISRIKIK